MLGTVRALPRGVIALGLVSLFMDISSEMIHSLLPIFLVGVLGVSALSVGLIEGVAEGVVSVAKLFSGAWSDWLGRRKPLLLAGYGLAALMKPLFPLAGSATTVFTARVVDRIGKGIRGAPRDALVADLTVPELRGAAYGLRQSMDTVGAVVGPGLAMVLMWLTAGNFRAVFWWACLPAWIAVAIIVFAVTEPDRPAQNTPPRQVFRLETLSRFHWRYWQLVAVMVLLMLARFSEAFLLLRGQSVGLSAGAVPVILIVMNIAYAASAYPLGAWSDRIPREKLLAWGLVVLIVSEILLAGASSLTLVYGGTVLWGLHMGATQGLMSAMVASACPADLRGTAFGVFSLIGSLATLAASVIAGALWTWLGPAATFTAGTGFAVAAWLVLWRTNHWGQGQDVPPTPTYN